MSLIYFPTRKRSRSHSLPYVCLAGLPVIFIFSSRNGDIFRYKVIGFRRFSISRWNFNKIVDYESDIPDGGRWKYCVEEMFGLMLQ